MFVVVFLQMFMSFRRLIEYLSVVFISFIVPTTTFTLGGDIRGDVRFIRSDITLRRSIIAMRCATTSKLVKDIDIIESSPTVDLLGPINTPTVWSYFNNLTTSDTANLGQGFPDTPPPKFLTDSLKETIDSGYAIHQYTNPSGHPPLVKEVRTYHTSYTQHTHNIHTNNKNNPSS